jgi:hypothetical protein
MTALDSLKAYFAAAAEAHKALKLPYLTSRG